MRTAAACGIRDIFLPPSGPSPFNPIAIRASAGRVFHLNFHDAQQAEEVSHS